MSEGPCRPGGSDWEKKHFSSKGFQNLSWFIVRMSRMFECLGLSRIVGLRFSHDMVCFLQTLDFKQHRLGLIHAKKVLPNNVGFHQQGCNMCKKEVDM